MSGRLYYNTVISSKPATISWWDRRFRLSRFALWGRIASWPVSNRPLRAEQPRPGSADEIGAQLAKPPHSR
jgi:hypothetical protein